MRDPLHWMSVKHKLSLAFAGLCLLAFGVGGFLISRSARHALEQQIDARIELQCRASARALDDGLRLLGRRTEDFASDGFIRERFSALLSAATDEERAGLQADLERHLSMNKLPLVPAFVALTLASPDGAIVVHSGIDVAPRLRGVLDAARGTHGVLHSDLLAPRGEDDEPGQAVVTPLRSLDGSAELGRLVAWVDPRVWVESSLAGLQPSAADDAERHTPVSLRIVDRRGGSLAPTEAGGGTVIVYAPPSAATHAPPPETGFARTLAIPENGWEVRVRLRTLDAFAPVSGLQSRFLGVGVVLALLCAGLLFFPMRFLVRPLGQLRDAALRIRGGDYSVRVGSQSEDEVGELARAFDHMAESVDEHTARLRRAAEELRVQQRELRLQHDQLDTVIRTLHDGLVVLDADGRPVLSNAAARPLVDMLARQDERLASHYACRRGESTSACSACLLRREDDVSTCVLDVGERAYEVHVSLLPSGAEGRRGRVLVARDITERLARDERDIHRERLSVLGEVAAVMAHELNNPLTSIRMFAQMLASGLPAGSPHREQADVIVRNTETCRRSIGELLGYATDSAPEAGPVAVHEVLHDVARFVRPLAERAGTELRTELRAATDTIVGDEIQIRQLFVNLVLNAVQATEDPGVTVTLATRDEQGALVTDVVDTGPGIPEDVRPRIFDAFVSTKPRGQGTGLGLPTARRIAELHGGGVELVESAPGRTVFRVRLRQAASVPGAVA